MRDLSSHLKHLIECGEGCSTPANTPGMGNVAMPDGDQPGTDGIPTAKVKKEKWRKKKKRTAEEEEEEVIQETLLDRDFEVDAGDMVLSKLQELLDKLLPAQALSEVDGAGKTMDELKALLVDIAKVNKEEDKSSIGKKLLAKDKTIIYYHESPHISEKSVSISRCFKDPFAEALFIRVRDEKTVHYNFTARAPKLKADGRLAKGSIICFVNGDFFDNLMQQHKDIFPYYKR